MPAYMTHVMFAQDALDSGTLALQACCERHQNLYRFGAQGPDVLRDLARMRPLSGLDTAAEALRGLDAVQVLTAMHELDSRRSDHPFICAYLCGFVSGIVLGDEAEAFLESRSAALAAERRITPSQAAQQLEEAFANEVLRRKYGRTVREYHPASDLPHGASEWRATARANAMLLSLTGKKGLPSEERLTSIMPHYGNLCGPMLTGYGPMLMMVKLRLGGLAPPPERGDKKPTISESDFSQMSDMYYNALSRYLYLLGR